MIPRAGRFGNFPAEIIVLNVLEGFRPFAIILKKQGSSPE
jgi:hypothetical protein